MFDDRSFRNRLYWNQQVREQIFYVRKARSKPELIPDHTERLVNGLRNTLRNRDNYAYMR